MRRIIFLLLVSICVIFLPSCGQKPAAPAEPITLFPPHSETATEEPFETKPAGPALANKTYGQITEQASFGLVSDFSETYRSDASYALEPAALAAAKSMFAKTVSRPDTLRLQDVQVIGCAEDTESVYYRVFLKAAYRVETGEEIRRDAFLDIGVRQSDKTAFDATQTLPDVFRRYSIFSDNIVFAEIPQADAESPDFNDAAMQITARQLKKQESGKAVRAVRRDDLCEEPHLSVYDVLCVGVNDYDAEIPCVYTVYMSYENGVVKQLDPNTIQF